jgi:hypothetical protein
LTASPSTPLDRFALDLDRFVRSTPSTSTASPSTPLDRFTLDLDHFAQSTPPTSTASPTLPTEHFADTPDRTLCSTPSFPSPQVIHEELVSYFLVLIVHCSDLFTHKSMIRFLHKKFAIYICVV